MFHNRFSGKKKTYDHHTRANGELNILLENNASVVPEFVAARTVA
jgi:hypothetical protein